ncbi:MAG: MCE family protein [Alistipes sp.]|nr:MCE family protein [Candidatus Alistipes equi]
MRRETKVGIYAVVIIGAACLMIEYLTGKDLLHRTSEYYSYYEDVTGLRPSTPVLIKGVKLGQVKKITIDADDPSKVCVVYTIPSSYKIPDNSVTRIFSNGLLGGKSLSIDLGDSKNYVEEDGEILSCVQLDIIDKMNKEFDSVKERIDVLLENTNRTVKMVNTVMEENSETIKAFISNIGALSKKLNNSSIVADVEHLSQSLRRSSDHIEGIVENAEEFSARLKAANFAENLTRSLENLKSILNKIECGDGNLGKLLNDDELYARLTAASDNLSLLLSDVKENPRRYINVSVFGGRTKLERANDKEQTRLFHKQIRQNRREERRMNVSNK